MGVYRRHNKLWLRYVDAKGVLVRKPTAYRPGQEKLAEKALELIRAMEEAGEKYADPLTGTVTVERYAKQWLRDREAQGVDTWKDDRGRLEHHILPAIGGMKIADVRARHLVALFTDLRGKKDGPSPKTIRNIYGTIRTLFRDAQIADLVISSPCVLTARQLGPVEQRDPLERVAELFTHAEVERLISAPEIDPDRRVFYALEALAGLRLGEAAGLRWMHYDPAAEPLGRLTITTSYDKGRTKTRRARHVPVHPTLAAMLAEWRMAWPSTFARQPTPEDLVVPYLRRHGRQGHQLETGSVRTKSAVHKAFTRDLAALGVRHRRGHDLRATFISLAEEDGADRDRIEDVTHTTRQSRRGAFEGYLRRAWPTLCAEVSKLRISRRQPADVVKLGDPAAQPTAQTLRNIP
jgi:integrase